MKKINLKRKNIMSATAALLMLFIVALGCGGEKPSAPPTEAESQALVKSTMADFAGAIEKGDFKAFRENSSKEFQSQFSDEQVKTTFKSFTDQKDLIVPILKEAAQMTPKFTSPPAVREENGYSVLVTNGSFATDPATKFTNEYVYQGGKWKLLKINVQM